MTADTGGERATVVCCLEAGRLEAQTVLMVRSLRAFGGVLADARVLAVVGRAGPPLLPETVEMLRDLQVEIRRAPRGGVGFEWMGYSNKVRAMLLAQEIAKTEQVIWLDSDILVFDDLSELLLPDGVDIAVRQEAVTHSVSAGDRGNEGYWRALAALLGADYDKMPWLDEGAGAQLAYFSSGVITWRRASDFVRRYADAFVRLLRSRLAQRNGSFFAADQVILAPVITGGAYAWLHLPLRSHRVVNPALLQSDERSWAGSALLHYSGSRDGDLRPIFDRRLAKEMPHAAAWLAAQSTPDADRGRRDKLLAAALKIYRHLRWRLYAGRVRKAV